MKPVRLLREFFRATWLYYFISISLHLVANIVQVYFPRMLGEFTDELTQDGLTVALVERYALILLMIGIGFVVIGGVAQYLVMYTGRFFEFMARRKLFTHFAGLSERFYSNNGVGKLLSYFMNDVTSVRESISMCVNQTANTSMMLIATVWMMYVSDIPVYLIAASIIPLLSIPLIVVRFGPIIRKRSLKVQESLGAMTESAEEQFGGIRVTKKFAVEPIMIHRFGETVERIRDNQLHLVRVSSLFQALVPFLGTISLIIAISLGGYLTITDRISIGTFIALTLYVRALMNPLQQIGNVINIIQRSRASLHRLNELFAVEADIQEDERAVEVDLKRTTIRVNQLSFTYGDAGEAALRDINLDIKPGTTVGIVGRTGSGKTTLMKLLLRTYDPPENTIFFGDEDIRHLSLESLRSQIAYVPQDGFLFSSSLRENIAFYRRNASMDEVEAAAKHAEIYDSIMEFPDRFETKIGERGVTLSGGQRQRTSLARGIIKSAPIMILDDSVSAVDAVTETNIIESIRTERKNQTTIIIAHRISAVKHADEIIVLDRGVIVQRGTHETLILQEGLYATFHAIQEEGSQHVASY